MVIHMSICLTVKTLVSALALTSALRSSEEKDSIGLNKLSLSALPNLRMWLAKVRC